MSEPSDLLREGGAVLGVELGSTRIKACLTDERLGVIASGSHDWANQLVDGRWTYSLEAIQTGMQQAYAALVTNAQSRHGVRPTRYRAAGVSAMMHGYLPFSASGELLVPFRTWRNTSTGAASAALSQALDFTIPLRWSIAHLYQAVLDQEAHIGQVAGITTLAGHVHRQLTGENLLGVGDASGVFPIDPNTRDYDLAMLDQASALVGLGDLRRLLPPVSVAGQPAGELTEAGARWLDPTGELQPGVRFCPPEGDAGTGMVATQAVAPRTGNVSVGTSIFAMVVLERPLAQRHPELDVVTTPTGDAVAMVHCNNGASELGAWAGIFGEFAAALGTEANPDRVYATLFGAAQAAAPDADGLVSFNYLAGEPVTGIDHGRPLLLRSAESPFSLGALIRSELWGAFATLAIGMDVLAAEQVQVDQLTAHGGLFRTPGLPQRALAAALRVPIGVQQTAGEGGAWGMAILAAYLDHADQRLDDFLAQVVFADQQQTLANPDPTEVAGFADYLGRFRAALPVQQAAGALGQTAPDTGDPRDGADAALREAVAATRQRVADLHQELVSNQLVVWTGGNVSERVPGADLFVIKPSGVASAELTAENQVVCTLDGEPAPGWGNSHGPSSDTAAHAYVYREMPEVHGVVHTHSPYATAWAARGEAIPCVITAMADEFGGEIPVGPFAIIGDDSIGRGIVETLRGHRSRAVLMANHGVFTIGKHAKDAVKAAVMCEDVARTVHLARTLGEPLPIEPANIKRLHDRYQNVYGQNPEGSLQ